MRTAAPSLLVTLAFSLVAAHVAHAEIVWEKNLRSAHAKAQTEGKLLLLHFYSDNCTWCDRLEAGAFKAPQVGETISQNFIPVKVHANSSPKLAEMFKVTKFPTDVIVTTEGKTLSHTVSPQNPDRYVAMLSSSVPSDAAAKVAEKVDPAPSPSPTTQAAAADKPVSAPSVGGSIPGYAAGPSAGSVAKADVSVAEMQLPGKSLSTGVQARLAGSRSPGMTLQMPGQAPAESNPTASSFAMPGLGANEVADLPAPGAAASLALPVNDSLSATIGDSSSMQSVTSEDPELAMQGFCPVTVINEDQWIEGKAEFGVIHLGKLYLFTSEQAMKTFLADPVPYTPVLNEIDVVRFFEERKIVPGKREWGLKDPVYNRMFFFADEAAMNHFYNEYERYTDAAIEVMDKAVKDANPGT
ncbi:MAG: DUF255 domain-containing protein [Rubripirellula sp.]